MRGADYFKDKKITLMGLGLLGRGVGDAAFLAPLCKELIVTDLKSEEELATSLERLKGFSNVHYTLGGHDLADFHDRDLILKAAGVPLDSIYIAKAKQNGIPVRMSADLLVELSQVASVGITGTRGKSTVTHMIGHVLKHVGKKVLLGGNVRGVSSLSLLPEVTPDTILVLELDSWQCQGFGEGKLSPHVAVFTNLMKDHANYYKGDTEQYFADKANIYRFQKQGDAFIAGATIVEKIRADNPPVAPTVPEPLPSDWKMKVIGDHNRENASLAVGALRALGLSEEDIRSGLESFEAVEGRLQFLREVNGVRMYNDNNATTPEATLEALKALDEGTRNIVLIMGGADKGLDMGGLLIAIPDRVKRLVMLPGTGTNRVLPYVPGASVYDSMHTAVAEALQAAEAGDIILFSPAFASFGIFKNEYDRNDQFVAAVSDIA